MGWFDIGAQGSKRFKRMAAVDVKGLPVVTREEVARHNTKLDLWVIVDDLVLNVTAFGYHPGGMGPFLSNPGGDVTRRFYEVNHSDEAKEALKRLAVARLAPKSASSNWWAFSTLAAAVAAFSLYTTNKSSK